VPPALGIEEFGGNVLYFYFTHDEWMIVIFKAYPKVLIILS